MRGRKEGVVALHLPTGLLKNLLWVGASTEVWTQYLPAIGWWLNHCTIWAGFDLLLMVLIQTTWILFYISTTS